MTTGNFWTLAFALWALYLTPWAIAAIVITTLRDRKGPSGRL